MQSKLSVIDKLIRTPQSFDFFQAVRVLTQYRRQDLVRYCGKASLQFPVSAISASKIAVGNAAGIDELQVTFLGLYGCNGILPNHYTELIIQRLQAKDTALRDFLDIFNHRIVALFYRSWKKYHFYAAYEHAQLVGADDKFTQMLAALIGNGTQHLQHRLPIPDESFLYYAGLFGKLPRSACALQAILSDYFAMNVEIKQCQGKWLYLQKDICTRLINTQRKLESYNRLGSTALLGRQVWEIQNNFRIKIGKLSYEDFLAFLPNKNKLFLLAAMTRRYIGINFNFDVQLNLRKEEVPKCSLLGKNALGWNSWLSSKPMIRNAEDTILSTTRIPSPASGRGLG